MSNKEMADFLSKLRDRNEMPIDEKEYHLLGEIAERLKETTVIRCKDYKHRPVKIKPDYAFAHTRLEFPDHVCPCQCDDDAYYSWYPSDDWFCAGGEHK